MSIGSREFRRPIVLGRLQLISRDRGAQSRPTKRDAATGTRAAVLFSGRAPNLEERPRQRWPDSTRKIWIRTMMGEAGAER